MGSTISGSDYLAIAGYYADARLKMLNTVNDFYDAVVTIVRLNTIQPTIDLLGDFYTAYLLNQSRLQSTSSFQSAVASLQQHILQYGGQASVSAWIAANVPGGLVPYEWGQLSAAVGHPINTAQINPATNPVYNSSSSSNFYYNE